MATLVTNRSFVYRGTAIGIKEWLAKKGFAMQDITTTSGTLLSFTVQGTSIKVGYDTPLTPFDTGRRSVHLLNDPGFVINEPEAAQRGLDLYLKLYRKFRDPKWKEV